MTRHAGRATGLEGFPETFVARTPNPHAVPLLLLSHFQQSRSSIAAVHHSCEWSQTLEPTCCAESFVGKSRAWCCAGSTASLGGLNGMTSSASHPDLTAAAYLPVQSESPTRGGLLLGGSPQMSNYLNSTSFTPEQASPCRSSGRSSFSTCGVRVSAYAPYFKVVVKMMMRYNTEAAPSSCCQWALCWVVRLAGYGSKEVAADRLPVVPNESSTPGTACGVVLPLLLLISHPGQGSMRTLCRWLRCRAVGCWAASVRRALAIAGEGG